VRKLENIYICVVYTTHREFEVCTENGDTAIFKNKEQVYVSYPEGNCHTKRFIVSFNLVTIECIPVSDGICKSNRDPPENFRGKDDIWRIRPSLIISKARYQELRKFKWK